MPFKFIKQQGIALLLCLFFMFLFSSIAIYISAKSKQEIELVRAFEQKLDAKISSYNLANELMYKLASKEQTVLATVNKGWQKSSEQLSYNISAAETMVSFSDLNQGHIFDLLVANGMSRVDVDKFMRTLQKWQRPTTNFVEIARKEARGDVLASLTELKYVYDLPDNVKQFIKRNFLLYRPVEQNLNWHNHEISELLGKDNSLNSEQSPYYVIDILAESELQSFRVRYGVNLWYSSENEKIIFEYLRQ